jgi:predicted deacylase
MQILPTRCHRMPKVRLQISRLIGYTLLNIFFSLITLQGAFAESTCGNGNVSINWQFEAGAIGGCEFVNAETVVLNLVPENIPINSSPWYAFEVSAKQAQSVNVTLSVGERKPRYLPKIRMAGEQWQALPYEINVNTMRFNVLVTEQVQTIAGQELLVSHHYQQWFEKHKKDPQITVKEIGQSSEHRPILALQYQPKSPAKEWLIVLGRQHPPEVTGAMALFAFVDQLLDQTAQNQGFLQRFNVLVIPMLNPDGVSKGNWRHNANGMDLNRDWKAFSQVETQAVKRRLDEITMAGENIVYAIDFHSTWHDVFYTMPSDHGAQPAHFTEEWLDTLAKQISAEQIHFKVLQKPGTNQDTGVFKQFIADTYGVHAITYEMGDNTDRQVIKQVAEIAADSLMTKLLATEASAFSSVSTNDKSMPTQ